MLAHYTPPSSDANGQSHSLSFLNYTEVEKLVPTINGYKRLVGGEAFWAPNAITYGYDSRAASIRIISPPSVPPGATRLEVRIPGADMNPYFALSAIFLLGCRGINNKMGLPGPPMSHLTPEDKKNGKVRILMAILSDSALKYVPPQRSSCCLHLWSRLQRE
jgi:glutamine synthetase